MEIVLQVAGVVVPCFAALGGLFAWGVRRMDRRFEEARQDRVRIEAKLDSRCDAIDARCDAIEAKLDARCDTTDAKFHARCDRMEAMFEDRWSRIEERIDRVGDQLSRQITELNREVGKLQGIAGAARFQEVASGSG